MTTEFVKGWLLLDTLGEGRFGEVKLLMNQETQEMVAVKVLIVKNIEMDKSIRKEICIHKNLQHQNVIGFFGNRRDDESKIEYLFLEYAQNGELFEHIEPDVGMPKSKAFKFFNDLINGVDFLHQRGIVHRDIKPENLLLDSKNQLKISDFGTATLFRHNGKERLLTQMCGTIPYIAPEVLEGQPHRAQPIDIWSCGIVLLVMLSGELPWTEATLKDRLFLEWYKGNLNLHVGPWCKIETIAFINNQFDERQKFNLKRHRGNGCFSSSQPQQTAVYSQNLARKGNQNELMDLDCSYDDENDSDHRNDWTSFSQPNRIADMFLSTQSQLEFDENGISSGSNGLTPPGTKLYFKVVKRMTRFWANKNFQKTLEILEKTFDDLNWSFKKYSPGQYKITMVDRNRIPLVFRSSVNEMSSKKVLVDFRLSRGDGIEFKRQFLIVKNLLNPIIRSSEILTENLHV
ncbi:hypothetical protein NH340_JMT05743 [Sarcoptes scabiei]|nr:hypothetical protein NH340_JMT05743 [Sarcoptes scabiei]